MRPRLGPLAAGLTVVLSFWLGAPAPPVGAGTVAVPLPVAVVSDRLGLCDVLPGSPPGTSTSWAQLAYNAGARINRWEFRWDRIEPSAHHWDFSADDAAVESSAAAGLHVEGILIGTPAWATAPGQLRGNGVPRNLGASVRAARNLWAAYVRRTVRHYRGLVQYWEVWNEPDLRSFWGGTAQDYSALLRVTYTVVKQVDPAAQVLVAGMVVPDLSFLRTVLRQARRPGGGPPFDAVAWHAYGPAHAVYVNIRRVQRLLATTGYSGTPVWVTEDGFPASNPAGDLRQAAYVVETAAYALSAGAAHVLIYRASDDTTPKHWGLMTASGGARPAYLGFQQAAQYLANAQAILYRPVEGLERFILYEAGRRVTLLWNRGQADVALPVTPNGPGASLINELGTAQSLPPAADTVVIPGAGYNRGIDPTNSVVGGPARFVVESNAPVRGAGFAAYLPPAKANGAQADLFNPGPSALTVGISADSDPVRRLTVQLAPWEVRTIDLAELSQPGETPAFRLRATGAVDALVQSSGEARPAVAESAGWFLPSAPGAIRLSHTSGGTVSALITAYGARGRIVSHETLVVPPGAGTVWTETSGAAALTVQASHPLMVTDAAGMPVAGTADARPTWYGIRPAASRLDVFNPGPLTAHIDIAYHGSALANAQHLDLPAGRSDAVPADGAHAVILAADVPVSAGYDGAGTAALPPGPATSGDLVTDGALRHLAVFNPSGDPAHLTLLLHSAAGTATRNVTVAVSHTVLVPVRGTSSGPRGVTWTSDQSVVALAVP